MIPDKFDYEADWWQRLSRSYREEKGWRCEECGISLYEHTSYLDTHHIQGSQYNEPEYLKALCHGCHAEQPGHEFLKEKQKYENFMRDYEDEWRRLRNL